MKSKTILKKYAIWARQQLMSDIQEKLSGHGIDELVIKSIDDDQKQVGGEAFVEKTAQIWFVRILMVRWMKVNGYLPSEISDGGWNQEKIILSCRHLARLMPRLFPQKEEYADQIVPDSLLTLFERMEDMIPDEDWKQGKCGRVENIGWLYQYFNSERHDDVVDPLHGKVIEKKDIPVATQVWTPEWIVQYITENSLGRYILDRHSNAVFSESLEYLIKGTKAEKSVEDQSFRPTSLRILDPCMGSGNFLIYAFDLLIRYYHDEGWDYASAVHEILMHNLVGFDIDDRVVRIGYFSLMMRAMYYVPSLFQMDSIPEPVLMTVMTGDYLSDDEITLMSQGDHKVHKTIVGMMKCFEHADEFGSLIQFEGGERCLEILNRLCGQDCDKFDSALIKKIHELKRFIEIYIDKYDVVLTNPPYLNKYDSGLKKFMKKHYNDYSADLFSAFMVRCLEFCKSSGYVGMMTPNVWMFIKSYQNLRRLIVHEHNISSLIQLAKGSFFNEATVDVCVFVLQALCDDGRKEGVYYRLEDFKGNLETQRVKLIEAIKDEKCGYVFRISCRDFKQLPGMPIAYWMNKKIIACFKKGISLEEIATPRQGLATTDNKHYLRHWFEVDPSRIGFNFDRKSALESDYKWFPYNKGGLYRKWYGNQDYIVNYAHDGKEIKRSVMTKYPYLKNPGYVVKNPNTYFSPSISWSKISSGNVAFRYFPQGFLYDVSGCSIFFDDEESMHYVTGFLNSFVCRKILEIISPTVNYEIGHIAVLPVIESKQYKHVIADLVKANIQLSKEDWDSFENSWNFKRHPLVRKHISQISEAYGQWKTECDERFEHMRENEETINRILIKIYGLDGEVSPEVVDKDVTVRRANEGREIRSLISYAVGCMFGRFSLDENGRNPEAIDKHFWFAKKNVVPITDGQFFKDDIVARFYDFIEYIYGKETLQDNMSYISRVLGNKGDKPEATIRRYFCEEFYRDHLKVYQSLPIYWMIKGIEMGDTRFLISMHRYHSDDVSWICDHYIDCLKKWVIEPGDSSMKPDVRVRDQIDRCLEMLHRFESKKIEIDLDDGIRGNLDKMGDILLLRT